MPRPMIVGFAAHRSALHHRIVSHQVASQALRMRAASRAAYIAVADIVVCILEDSLIERLGLGTDARAAVLSRTSQRHIMERRQLSSRGDAELAANRVHEALADLRFIEVPHGPSSCNVVGHVASAGRLLLIVLKAVPAARASSGSDELWISTAYPLGQKKARQWHAIGKLAPLR